MAIFVLVGVNIDLSLAAVSAVITKRSSNPSLMTPDPSGSRTVRRHHASGCP